MTDKTNNLGYPLPHPDNIAVEDVSRIRKSIEKIDQDISNIINKNKTTSLEKFIEL